MYPHQFKAIVIFEGNDITGSKTDKRPSEVVKLFKAIVRQIRAKYPDTPVFLYEITPTKSRWAVWTEVKSTNSMLKETCAKLHKTYFIDTANYYLNEKGEPRTELFIKDFLHQNHEGYKIWGDLVRKKLDEVFMTANK